MDYYDDEEFYCFIDGKVEYWSQLPIQWFLDCSCLKNQNDSLLNDEEITMAPWNGSMVPRWKKILMVPEGLLRRVMNDFIVWKEDQMISY